MESEETQILNTAKELPSDLHKVFVDLSLENDLKGEELEWFKLKISPQLVQDENEEKQNLEQKQMEILTEYILEKLPEKPNKILLKLSETETIWFLSLETHFSQEQAEDAEKVRRENETYKVKKTKKEIIRKRWMADAQTPRCIVKSKETLTTEIVMKDAFIFASEWDMYDTYNALNACEESSTGKDLMVKVSPQSVNEVPVSREEEAHKVFATFPFKYATLVTERLLATNCFQSKQAIFKKDIKTRYDIQPVLFTYSMELLWSFEKDLEQPLSVTDMDWNTLNQDLLAVGYGSLNFGKESKGLICVWSSKNPRQPERRFWFETSVTCLNYSKCQPNILAVGTRNGKVYVLNVSDPEGNLRLLGRESLKTHSVPIWKVEWFMHKELVFETEKLLAVGESGVLMIFSTSIDKDPTDVLKLSYVTSTEKFSIKIPSKKISRQPTFYNEIFNKKTFSGLSFSIYSDNNFCYMSTKEGAIVKCNLMSPSMTDGVFLGHNGPVYVIQHSPVTDLIFLTCGADWKIKIWMEGISEPLLILQQKVPVVCARWSPTIPTLIASVGESELSLWDISRNILSPMSIKSFEDCGQTLCNVLFSSNGANLMVGCEGGAVLVVHFSGLPRIPFLQKEALISALRKTLLENKNELFEKFRRTVEANKDKLKTNVLDNLKSF